MSDTVRPGLRLGRSRAAISVLFFLLGAGFGSWAARIPDIQKTFGLSKGTLGVALLAVAIGSLIGMPLAGALAARVDARILTGGCALAFAVTVALPPLAPGFLGLCTVLLILGTTSGALGGVINAQASLLEHRVRRPIMSSCHAIFSIGALSGSLSSGAVAYAGIPAPVHLLTVAATLLAIAAWAGPGLLRARPAPRAQTLARPHRGLLPFGLLAFCVLFSEGAVTDWSAVYLRHEIGAGIAAASTGYAAFATSMATGRLAGDRLAAAFGPRRLVATAGILATIGAVVLLLAPTTTLAVTGFTLLGAGLSVTFPNALAAAARRGQGQAGAAIAAVSTVGYIGFLFGPPLIGLIAELAGLRTGLVILLVCASGVLLLSRTLPTRSTAAEV